MLSGRAGGGEKPVCGPKLVHEQPAALQMLRPAHAARLQLAVILFLRASQTAWRHRLEICARWHEAASHSSKAP